MELEFDGSRYTRKDPSNSSNALRMSAPSAASRHQYVGPVLRERRNSVTAGPPTLSNASQTAPSFMGAQGGGSAPEGSSTSAALNSPTIYSGRSPMKRFAIQTLDSDSDISSDRHPTYTDEEQGSFVTYNGYPNGHPHEQVYGGRAQSTRLPRRPSPISWLARSSPLITRGKRTRDPVTLPKNGHDSNIKYVATHLTRYSLTPQIFAVLVFLLLLYALLPGSNLPEPETPPAWTSLDQGSVKETTQLPSRRWWEPADTLIDGLSSPKSVTPCPIIALSIGLISCLPSYRHQTHFFCYSSPYVLTINEATLSLFNTLKRGTTYLRTAALRNYFNAISNGCYRLLKRISQRIRSFLSRPLRSPRCISSDLIEAECPPLISEIARRA